MASAVLVKEVSPDKMSLECDVGANGAGETSIEREEATNYDDGSETTDDDPPRTKTNQRRNGDKEREDAAIAAALSWNPLEEVDSALLSAMCDARERKALLRLERVLVEFMKEAHATRVEVGGAYNSIVLGNGEGVDQPVVSTQTLQEIQFQQQRGLRQTSFQRLILHRLADRFRIIREVIPSSHDNIVTALNLIRLIKTEESAVPQHLLIDVDLALLVDYKNPLARDSRPSASAMPPNNHDEDLKLLSDSMGSSTLQENASPAQTSSKKSKKKMVIMKRNSAGGPGAEDKAKSKREGKSRLKGKKLVDKEKAYEEARARIFGVTETTTATAEDGSNNPDSATEKITQLNPQSPEFAPQSTNNLGDSNHSVPVVASETPGATEETAKSPEQNEEETSTIISSDDPKEAVSSETQANNSKQGSTAASTSSSSTHSASMATTKAVYRNRQQEENDPDFKRRSDIRPAYMPMPMVNGVPYLTTNPYAPNNPYVNMLNMAMGQQHPMSVLPGHPQPPHLAYYNHLHGQAPNPQAYHIFPNHNGMAPPQSPAYFVTNPQGKHSYPTPHPNATPPTNPAAAGANTVQNAPSGGKNDASSKKSSQSKPKRRDSSSSSPTPPNNESATEPPQDGPRVDACDDSRRGDAVPTFYAAEDFPALQ